MQVQNFSTLPGMKMNEWIRAARTHAKLTQEQLAERLGLTKGNVSAWENGRHEASHEQLVRLAALTRYPEPLPGMIEPASAPVTSWPFALLDEAKVRSMDSLRLAQLETAVLLAAAQLGLDVKKDT